MQEEGKLFFTFLHFFQKQIKFTFLQSKYKLESHFPSL